MHPTLPSSLEGRVALITGANTGLGFEAAKALRARGARVIVAGRSAARVDAAVAALNADSAGPSGTADASPTAGIAEAGIVDLADLGSVRHFAANVLQAHDRLDILLNNAGIMVPPAGTTAAGFELQFGVNFLGHFALTGVLFELLARTPGARVVTMSSIAHRGARIDFDDLRLEKPYDPWRAYGQSKLADLAFALELHERVHERGLDVASLGAHPGVSATELVRHLPGEAPPDVQFMPAAQGILPALVAACSPQAQSGQYWGPNGPGETAGDPAPAAIDPAAQDTAMRARLWDLAQDATGVSWL